MNEKKEEKISLLNGFVDKPLIIFRKEAYEVLMKPGGSAKESGAET